MSILLAIIAAIELILLLRAHRKIKQLRHGQREWRRMAEDEANASAVLHTQIFQLNRTNAGLATVVERQDAELKNLRGETLATA